MDRRRFLTTVATGSVALSGCVSTLLSGRANTPLPSVPEGAWTQHGADAANTFAPTVSAPPRGNLAWTSEAFTRWDPVFADGTVYTTNFDPNNEGSAIALDARDGSERWRTSLGEDGDHGRALVDDYFVVATDGELVALDKEDGGIASRHSLEGVRYDGGAGASPELLAADERSGTVVVPHEDGLQAIRPAEEERHWETTAIREPSLSPAIGNGTVYAIGRHDRTDALAAIALDDGAIRWTEELAAPSTSADPVVTAEGVLVVDGNTLGIHDPETGERRSEITLFEGEVDHLARTTTVAADGEMTFVADDETGLVAVDIEAGRTERLHDGWIYADGISVGIETVVAMVEGDQYVSDSNSSTITAFDRETGDARWNHVLESFHSPTIPPILADGAVFYATSATNALAALGDVPDSE